jgi:uncharacterized protein with von Willebrand factor type A (vWA) domain
VLPIMTSDAATGALVGFARLLRERGIRLSPAEVSRFQAAVGVLPPGIGHLYWAGRTCLAVPPGSAEIYDAAFAQYFLGRPGRPTAAARASLRPAGPGGRADLPQLPAALDIAREPNGDEPGPDRTDRAGRTASSAEVLRVTPFAQCTRQELATLAELVRRLRVRPPQRPDRRTRPGTHHEAVDLRTTARLAMKTQAEVLMPAWRQHRMRPRPVVVLLDVSRSMALYSRLFLHFGYALAANRRDVEVVCFGTQLTRVTGLLRSRRSARALERAAMSVLDWDGGTRIAEAVAGLRSMRSLRGRLRGAVVVICSDGLERGDPADLGVQMSLLRRTCHEVIWVNPLAGDKRYQPLAGGMRAAMPWVDRLMPGDTLAALGDVAAVLSGGTPEQPSRYRQGRPPAPRARGPWHAHHTRRVPDALPVLTGRR